MAKAARIAIVEAENIVPLGSIDPNDVHLPGIFIDRICPATEEKRLELKKTRPREGSSDEPAQKSDALERRDRIARRAAKELKDGFYVNLGVGESFQYALKGTGTDLSRFRYSNSSPVLLATRDKGMATI